MAKEVVRRALTDAQIAAALEAAATVLIGRRYAPPAEYAADHARRALMAEFMKGHHRVVCRGDILAAARMTLQFLPRLGLFAAPGG